MITLNPEDPKAYIVAHDKRVVSLDRKANAALRGIYLSAMGDADEILLMGGPQSHDELISAIVEMEFPDIRAAREAYIQSVVG